MKQVLILILLLFQAIRAQFTVSKNTPNVAPSAVQGPQAIAIDDVNRVFYVTGPANAGLFGQTLSNDGYQHLFVAKYYFNGTNAWARIINGNNFQVGTSVVVDTVTGNAIVGGFTFGSMNGLQYYPNDADGFIANYYPNGTLNYLSMIGAPGNDAVYGLAIDTLRYNILASGIFSGNLSVMIINPSNGSIVRQLLTPAVGYLYSVAVGDAAQGDIYSTGYTGAAIDGQSCSAGTNTVLIKWNMLNQTRYWSRVYCSSGQVGQGSSVVYDSNTQTVFVGGYTLGSINNQTNYGGFDQFVIATSSNGSLLWSLEFGTTNDDNCLAMALHAPSSNLILVGYVEDNSFKDYGIVAAVSKSGTLLLSQKTNYQNSYFQGLALSSNTPTYGIIADKNGFNVQLTLPISGAGGVTSTSSLSSTSFVITVPSSTAMVPTSTSSVSPSSFVANASISSSSSLAITNTSLAASTTTDSSVLFSTTTSSVSAVSVTTSISISSVIQSSTILAPISSFTPSAAITQSPSPSGSIVTVTQQVSTSPSTTSQALLQTSSNNVVEIPTINDVETTTTTSTTESTSTAPTTDSSSNGSSTTSPFSSNSTVLLPILYGGVALLVLVLVLVSAYLFYLRRKHRAKTESSSDKSYDVSKSITNYNSTSDSFTNSNTFMSDGRSNRTQSTATGLSNTTSATLCRTDFELSLPGYFRFREYETFHAVRMIAKGGGGQIFLGDAYIPDLQKYGSRIIIKKVGTDQDFSNKDMAEKVMCQFKQEVSIMHFLRNERNVAKLLGWSEDPLCMLMKFYQYGSLDELIDNHDFMISKRLRVSFMKDVASGLLAMHQAGFVHCDIKPQNILIDVDEKNRPFGVLTDFGISKIVDDKSLLVHGFNVVVVKGMSLTYAAPEIIKRFRSNESVTADNVSGDLIMKADIYAWGFITYEILTRRCVFETETKTS